MTTRRLASLVFGLVVTISLGLAATPAGAQVIEVPPFRLGPPIIGHLQDVDVSFGDDGTLVYVWGEYDLRPPFRNENDHVVSQWFSVDGVAIKPPVVVDTSGGVFNPVIHSDLRGGHLASWLWIGNRIYRVRTRSVNAGGRGGAAGPDFQADRNGLGPAGFSTFALGLPDGFAYVWNQNGMRLRTFFANGRPRGIDQKFSRGGYRLDGAVLPDGGFITVWSFGANGRIFDGDGTPRTDNFVFSDTVSVTRVATSPAGDIAALGTHQDETSLDVVVVRLASDGTPMREFTVVSIPDAAPGNPFIYADLDFDHYGNLLVVTTISDNDVAEANVAPTVRAYAPDDTLLGPPLTLTSMLGVEPRVVRLGERDYDGSGFAVLWYRGGRAESSIVSLTNVSSGTCGDGLLASGWERCDTGAANSDSQPDACRTTCIPARCGDGVVDSGESCDDGNLASCDGCSGSCVLESGGVCGDGVLNPSCGEECDDGNGMSGDGCNGACRIEKIHSKGRKLARCFAQWSVANPTNYPGRDRRGEFERKHECIDNDPLCDFDGGTRGTCTFHARLCANYSEPAQQGAPQPCVSTPIDTWKIKRPSLANAAKKPLDDRNHAAILNAAAVLDSTQPDVCSNEVALEVPLRGRPGNWRRGRKVFEVHARSNDLLDKDRIMLSCLPEASSARKAPRFSDVWENVLSKHCTFCHNPQEECCNFLDFTTLEAARSTLSDVGREECAGYQRVVSGNPDLSLLYRKLVDPDVCGVRMPAQMTFPEAFHDCEGTNCLDAADVQMIRRWILNK